MGSMNTNTQTEMVEGSDSPVVEVPAATETAAPDDVTKLREMLRKANKEATDRRHELERLQKAQADAAEKQAAEQGEYQKLWQAEKDARAKEAERVAQLEAQIKAQELTAQRAKIAAAKGLPPALAERLQGETEEEITADADALLKALPLPAAAALDGGARGKGAGTDPQAAKRILSTYNIDPRYLEE